MDEVARVLFAVAVGIESGGADLNALAAEVLHIAGEVAVVDGAVVVDVARDVVEAVYRTLRAVLQAVVAVLYQNIVPDRPYAVEVHVGKLAAADERVFIDQRYTVGKIYRAERGALIKDK